MITPGCSNPKVTDRGLKTINRLCARDDFQGPAGAIFAVNELKAKKLAIFDDGTTGPRGAADEAEKQAKSMGATVLRYVIRAGDKDFRAILGTVPKDINAIYASVWAPDAALIAKQLPDVGLNVPHDRPRWPVRAHRLCPGLCRRRRGQLRHVLCAGHEEGPCRGEFVKAFEAKHGALSSYGPLAYEATNIMLEAVKKAGKPDRALIRDAVRATKDYKGILGQASLRR